MRQVTHDSSYETSISIRKKEKALSQQVSEVSKYHTVGSDFGEVVQYYSAATKRTLLEYGDDTEAHKLISQVTGRDVVVGKERFFYVPLWWNFGHVERASLLASSVELFKAAGLLQYFLELSRVKVREVLVVGGGDEAFATTNANVKISR